MLPSRVPAPLGGNRRCDQCLQDADADLAKAQACAHLVGQ
jgi:hypothetical protein